MINNRLEIGVRVRLPTKNGYFNIIPFLEKENGLEHIALIKGNFVFSDTVLTRIHSACATGDLFGSLRCDCGEQLQKALRMIEQEGKGLILYLQQEGRGIGLMNKIRAYQLQDEGLDTVDANVCLGFAPDERNYTIAAEMLKKLGVNQVRLMTNNPDKINGLESANIKVIERIPIEIQTNKYNFNYLHTKQTRMNHILDSIDAVEK